jgi:hypothetical protein
MAVKYVTSEGAVIPPMVVYSQDAEPTLDTDHKMCIWIDTNDSNKVYLVFRRGTGDQVKIELV